VAWCGAAELGAAGARLLRFPIRRTVQRRKGIGALAESVSSTVTIVSIRNVRYRARVKHGRTRRPSARERLLDAADELFYRDGIGRTSVDDVLGRAQVAPSTLYAHFAGKDGLIAGVLERRLMRWRELWRETIDAASGPEDRLLALFDAVGHYRDRYAPGRGCPFIATLTELPQPRHPARDVIQRETALLHRQLTELARDVTGDQPGVLARQILTIYDGAMTGVLRGLDDDPLAFGRTVAKTIIQAHVAGGAAKDRG
jgi:AcrR family transcriptional regulator